MEPTTTAATAPAPDRRSALQRAARALLWLPGAVWVVATPLVFVLALGQSMTFFGEQPTAAALQATTTGLVWAAVCCAGAPLAGLGLAGIARSRRGVWIYGVAFVLGCLPGLGWAAWRSDHAPTPAVRVTTCQEHSGGDTRCPGG